jgi:O-succinylbenzoic acid--CoA ligase
VEVEAALRAHPAVEDAGVVGVPDERWGQVPVAFVKLHDAATLTEPDLTAFCYTRLARYKVPAHIRFVESLPRNAAGKLLRRALLESWP